MKPFVLLVAVVLGLAYVASSAQACERVNDCAKPAPEALLDQRVYW
ncbi:MULTISPECIES: hypothetical protein [unclassified Thiocapsa]